MKFTIDLNMAAEIGFFAWDKFSKRSAYLLSISVLLYIF